MIIQAEATRGSTKSLQDHIAELRRQAGATRASGVQTDIFRTRLQRVGTQARQTGTSVADAATLAQERIRDAATLAQERIRAATSRVDRLHDALFRALRRKYERDRDAAMRAIDQQFSARRAAVEAQLDLLDETERREDFHAERAENVAELAMLRREAGYETDARRRAAIMNRVAEIEKELAEGQLRFDRDTRRRGLQKQLTALSTEEDTAKTSAKTLWEGRLSEAALGAKAEQMIIRNNQTEILNLLRTYGDGWRDIGVTFGQRLIEGMGPYATELSRMVQAALADVRAAADGTIAKLRKVAAAAPAAPVAPAGVGAGVAVPRVGAARGAVIGVRQEPEARQGRVGMGDLRRAERELVPAPAVAPFHRRLLVSPPMRPVTPLQKLLARLDQEREKIPDVLSPPYRPFHPAVTLGRAFGRIGQGVGRLGQRALARTPEELGVGKLIPGFVRELGQGIRGLLSIERPTPVVGMGDLRGAETRGITHTGPLVNIQSMNVRSEDDIRRVSQELHRHIQTQTRARGGR
ncbi:MAG: hypothetical protein DDT37_01854 [Firmicutes bacterium]|nr:hypothetical protein [candidate division NPL-UPA2 bacterium]